MINEFLAGLIPQSTTTKSVLSSGTSTLELDSVTFDMSDFHYYYTVKFEAGGVTLNVTSAHVRLYVREWVTEMAADTFTYIDNEVTLSCSLLVC